MLDIVLALNCHPNVIKSFKIDEAFQPVSLGKPVNETGSMFKNAADQVARYPYMQNPVGAICQNVDVTASDHGAIVKDVDGRDKPGHDDEGCVSRGPIGIPDNRWAVSGTTGGKS
jgi:hypothetical protein